MRPLFVSSSKPFSCHMEDFTFTRYPLYSQFAKPNSSLWYSYPTSKENCFPLPLWLNFASFDASQFLSLTPYKFRSKRFGTALVRKILKTGRNYLFTPFGVYTLFPSFGPCLFRGLPSSWTKFDWDFFSKSDIKELKEIGYVRASL